MEIKDRLKNWLYWLVYNFPIKGCKGAAILVWCDDGMSFKQLIKEFIYVKWEE